MIDILFKIGSAIATQEGAFGDPNNLPRRANNPGNLVYAGQPHSKPLTITGKDGKKRTFAEFEQWENGVAALYRQILKRIAEGHADGLGNWQPMTLRLLICDEKTGWAPSSDSNNSALYLHETCRRVGIGPDDKIISLLELEKRP